MSTLAKNHFLFGLLMGLVAPIIAFIFTEYTTLGLRFAAKPFALYAMATGVNLLLLRYFYRRDLPDSGKGMIFITFVVAIALFLREPLA